MFNIKLMLVLFVVGFIGNMILRKSDMIGFYIRSILGNQRGEGEAGVVEIPKELQPAVDKIVQDRLGRERAKFGDYDELKKFKTEFDQTKSQKEQEELVKQKKYEEAEGTYKKQIGDFSEKLTAKDREIQDLKISHHLSTEISKQGGYTEETIAMIKANTVLDANGAVVIKGKDANGVDITMPVAVGVEKFLKERPYLVKGTYKAGSGSGGNGGEGGGTGGGQDDTLESLNVKLAEAMRGTDLKLRSELKMKVKAALEKKRGVK